MSRVVGLLKKGLGLLVHAVVHFWQTLNDSSCIRCTWLIGRWLWSVTDGADVLRARQFISPMRTHARHSTLPASERGFIQYTLHRFLPDGARCARRSRCGADDEEDHGNESLD